MWPRRMTEPSLLLRINPYPVDVAHGLRSDGSARTGKSERKGHRHQQQQPASGFSSSCVVIRAMHVDACGRAPGGLAWRRCHTTGDGWVHRPACGKARRHGRACRPRKPFSGTGARVTDPCHVVLARRCSLPRLACRVPTRQQQRQLLAKASNGDDEGKADDTIKGTSFGGGWLPGTVTRRLHAVRMRCTCLPAPSFELCPLLLCLVCVSCWQTQQA